MGHSVWYRPVNSKVQTGIACTKRLWEEQKCFTRNCWPVRRANRSAHVRVTSKPKWQRDWRVKKYSRWFVFWMLLATHQHKFFSTLLLWMVNMLWSGSKFLCGALYFSPHELIWKMPHAHDSHSDHTCCIYTLIWEDWCLKFEILQQSWTFQQSQFHEIIHDKFGYRKVSSKGTPEQLSEQHKTTYMELPLGYLPEYKTTNRGFLNKFIMVMRPGPTTSHLKSWFHGMEAHLLLANKKSKTVS